MSLRGRLTLLTSALVAVVALVLGLAAFTAAQRVQLEIVDRALTAALANPRVKALEARLAAPSLEEAALIGLARLNPATGEITVLQTAGTSNSPVPFPSLTPDDIAAAALGPITVPGSPAQRVEIRELRPGRLAAVAAVSLADIQQAQRRLAIVLALAVAVVTAAGAVLAWLLVRRTMRPVASIADAATSIAAGDLSLRIPSVHHDVELGRLTAALNTMIASLTASLEQVQSSEDRLRRFVSDASHEIRTPLTVISGYAELLQRDPDRLDPMEVRAIQRIQSETERLERLVTQLLLLDRLEHGAMSDGVPFDLAAIVAEGLADIGRPMTGRPVDLDLVPTLVVGDPDDWRQVVANLAQNIERYTPTDSPVRAEVRRVGDVVVLTVDDAGPGIPADQRTAVMSRFRRADPSHSARTAGFGLGMSIIAGVVEGGGGTVTLADSPLGGLRVQITLPDRGSPDDLGSLRVGP